MPKDVTHFEQIEGIWACSVSCVTPVASALRISLIELAVLRRSSEGQQTKAQQIYSYLTGPEFKHRVECLAEKFTELRKDLDSELKWMTKQWAKRDRELTDCVGSNLRNVRRPSRDCRPEALRKFANCKGLWLPS